MMYSYLEHRRYTKVCMNNEKSSATWNWTAWTKEHLDRNNTCGTDGEEDET